MLKAKMDFLYMSKLFLKFLNTLIFFNFKLKMENLIYASFFFWKKKYKTTPLFFFFQALLTARPLIGFYLYIIKKKQKKTIKIKPYYMSFKGRWQKAIYWFTRFFKIEHTRTGLITTIIYEIYNITYSNVSSILKQKIKFYQTILFFKSTKNYKW